MPLKNRDDQGSLYTNDAGHLAYHKRNKSRDRLPGQLRIQVRFKGFIGAWFDYLLVSEDELREILQNTGWKAKYLIHGNDGQYIMLLDKQ